MPSGAPATFIFLLLVDREQATKEALGLSGLLVTLVALGLEQKKSDALSNATPTKYWT